MRTNFQEIMFLHFVPKPTYRYISVRAVSRKNVRFIEGRTVNLASAARKPHRTSLTTPILIVLQKAGVPPAYATRSRGMFRLPEVRLMFCEARKSCFLFVFLFPGHVVMFLSSTCDQRGCVFLWNKLSIKKCLAILPRLRLCWLLRYFYTVCATQFDGVGRQLRSLPRS